MALSSGIQQIVSVFDARMLRVLRTAGCEPRIVGEPRNFGHVKTYAGLFNISTNLHRHLLGQLQSGRGRNALVVPQGGLSSMQTPCARDMAQTPRGLVLAEAEQ